MQLRNRDGTPIDPVPFVVVAGLAFMLGLSLGPLYWQAYGLPLGPGVAVSAAVCLLAIAAAYHQLVWTARASDIDVPVESRAERLLYFALGLAALIIGLTLPLL